MLSGDLTLVIQKLVSGGIIAFLAIMLWSKTRRASWMCLVTGAVFSYAETVFELLVKLGIATSDKLYFWGFGVKGVQIALSAATAIFFIIAFIMMLLQAREEKNV